MSDAGNEKVKSHQDRPLLLFRSPINRDQEVELIESIKAANESSDGNSTSVLSKDLSHVALPDVHDANEHFSNKQPPLHRHHEARPIELFYDLFFVANLACFTQQNDVVTLDGLANYIGFFCVIWFTWAQVSLYDVRFSRDSVFDRIAKGGQLGVMAGFMFIAYYFDPAGQTPTYGGTGKVDGQALSLLLMGSRLILVLQYLLTAFSLRHYRPSRTPLLMSAAWSFLAAMLYLGISFKFGPSGAKNGNSNAYIAWYVVSIVETLLCLVVSIVWRSVSFKNTHICERMALLTLIVIGEGILSMGRGIVYVWGNTEYFVGLGAAVMSAIILLYSMYMLYFDTISQDHFGSIRQQIWVFMHFPFHLALILFDEGIKVFVTWVGAFKQLVSWTLALFTQVDLINYVSATYNTVGSIGKFNAARNSTEYFQNQTDLMMSTYDNFIASPDGTGVADYVDMDALANFTSIVRNGTNLPGPRVATAAANFYIEVIIAIFDNFGVASNYTVGSSESKTFDPQTNALGTEDIFSFTVTQGRYFYIGTGCAILLILALWLLSKKTKNNWFDYARFVMWFAVGLTIALLSLIDLKFDFLHAPTSVFANSDWVLPTPAILMVVLLVVHHLPFGVNRQKLRDSKV